MDTTSLIKKEPHLPSDEDQQLAAQSMRQLATHARNGALTLRIMEHGHDDDTLILPAAAVNLMLQLLTEMSKGHAITLMPYHAELTTQQAADMLNVSRTFVVKLCDDGDLSCTRLGTHRKIRFDDLMAFKRRSHAARHEALDKLAALHQAMGGYENP